MNAGEANLYNVIKDMLVQSLKSTNEKIDDVNIKVCEMQKALKLVNLVNGIIENNKGISFIFGALLLLAGFLGFKNYEEGKDIKALTEEVRMNHQSIEQFIAVINQLKSSK